MQLASVTRDIDKLGEAIYSGRAHLSQFFENLRGLRKKLVQSVKELVKVRKNILAYIRKLI
jgi:hypothetical protein